MNIHRKPSISQRAVAIVHARITESDIRKMAARRTFWSSHPLNVAAAEALGPTFSLKSYIAFVQTMPQSQFNACMLGAGVQS